MNDLSQLLLDVHAASGEGDHFWRYDSHLTGRMRRRFRGREYMVQCVCGETRTHKLPIKEEHIPTLWATVMDKARRSEH